MTARLRSPLPYPGGKGFLSGRILDLLPPPDKRQVFVEPFAGSASVLLAREPVGLEVLNDVNGDVVHFFRVLRDQGEELRETLRNVPYARSLYLEWADPGFVPEDDLERAARTFFVARASMMAGWQRPKPSGFAVDKKENRAAFFVSAVEALPLVRDRLRRVVIEKDDALRIIRRYDSEHTVFYCDPPYLPETRHSKQPDYLHEMSEADHLALLDTLKSCRGFVALSGYPSSLYTEALEAQGWQRVDLPTRCNQTRPRDGRPADDRRTESVWINKSYIR